MPWSDGTRARRIVALAGICLVLMMAVPGAVLAADPSATAAAAGDPRSSGAGPGLVGDPVWAIGIVLVIAVGALIASLAYVRATAARRDEPTS